MNYDPLGAMISDSGSDFKVAFGFRSGIIDSATNLVFFGELIYDTSTGRWMTPNYASFVEGVGAFSTEPEMANLYRNAWTVQHPKHKTSDMFSTGMIII